jgi:hypothetical protein
VQGLVHFSAVIRIWPTVVRPKTCTCPLGARDKNQKGLTAQGAMFAKRTQRDSKHVRHPIIPTTSMASDFPVLTRTRTATYETPEMRLRRLQQLLVLRKSSKRCEREAWPACFEGDRKVHGEGVTSHLREPQVTADFPEVSRSSHHTCAMPRRKSECVALAFSCGFGEGSRKFFGNMELRAYGRPLHTGVD